MSACDQSSFGCIKFLLGQDADLFKFCQLWELGDQVGRSVHSLQARSVVAAHGDYYVEQYNS